MRVTRRSFVAGISAAVLADWPAGVFADGAPRPFGAGTRGNEGSELIDTVKLIQ